MVTRRELLHQPLECPKGLATLNSGLSHRSDLQDKRAIGTYVNCLSWHLYGRRLLMRWAIGQLKIVMLPINIWYLQANWGY